MENGVVVLDLDLCIVCKEVLIQLCQHLLREAGMKRHTLQCCRAGIFDTKESISLYTDTAWWWMMRVLLSATSQSLCSALR